MEVVSEFPKRLGKKKVLCTHNQKFHCDDVLSTVLLRTLSEYSDSIVYRIGVQDSRNARREGISVMYDVGGRYDHSKKRYDHHQRGYFASFSENYKTKLCAAGQIWKHYGKELILNEVKRLAGKKGKVKITESEISMVHEAVYQDFFEHIDAGDNGISNFTKDIPKYKVLSILPCRVDRFNPSTYRLGKDTIDDDDFNSAFKEAYVYVKKEFQSVLTYFVGEWLHYVQIVLGYFRKRKEFDESGNFIFMKTWFTGWYFHCQFVTNFFRDRRDALHIIENVENCKEEEKVYFGVYFGRGYYNSKSVHKYPTAPFSNRIPFPETWRGLSGARLQKVSEVHDASFVHASGFLGCAATKKGVVKMSKKAIQLATSQKKK